MTKKAAKRPTMEAAKAPTKKAATKKPGKTKVAAGNLVDELRAAIVNSELSRYEIAKRAEVSEAVLSYFVNGQRSMTLDTAAKVAAVLGLALRPA